MALLEAKGVVQVFGELKALNGVDFDVEAGRFTAWSAPMARAKAR